MFLFTESILLKYSNTIIFPYYRIRNRDCVKFSLHTSLVLYLKKLNKIRQEK